MEIRDVTEHDLQRLQGLQLLLKSASIEIKPTDALDVAQTMIWIQELSKKAGKAYQEAKQASVASPGLNIKSMDPGAPRAARVKGKK